MISILLIYSNNNDTNKPNGDEKMLESFKVILEKIDDFTNKFKDNYKKLRGLIADIVEISSEFSAYTINHADAERDEFYNMISNREMTKKIENFRSFRYIILYITASPSNLYLITDTFT